MLLASFGVTEGMDRIYLWRHGTRRAAGVSQSEPYWCLARNPGTLLPCTYQALNILWVCTEEMPPLRDAGSTHQHARGEGAPPWSARSPTAGAAVPRHEQGRGGGSFSVKTSITPSSCSGKCQAKDLVAGTPALETDVNTNKPMFVLVSLCRSWSQIHCISQAQYFIINLLYI